MHDTVTTEPDDIRRQMLAKWDALVEEGGSPPLVIDDDKLMTGVDRFYSTAETAEFFGRSNQWMYYCMRNGRFTYAPVWHVRVAKANSADANTWHRYTQHPFEELRGRFTAVEEPDLTLSVLGEAEHGMEWTNETGTLVFKYFADPIEPIRLGLTNRRRFTLPVIREIALSCYRLGNFKEDELKSVLKRIFVAEFGASALESGMDE